jgi:hypothetical protein
VTTFLSSSPTTSGRQSGLHHAVGREREVAGGIVSGALSLTRVGKKGGVAMRQKLHWLDYDPVAFAVLAIGMAMIGLFASLI